MTTSEVLKELGISRATLYSRIREGLVTPVPPNAALKRAYPQRFRKQDVEKLKQVSGARQ